MTRTINCHKCRTYLGEIRDATIRKDTVYLCGACALPPRKAELPKDMKDLFSYFKVNKL